MSLPLTHYLKDFSSPSAAQPSFGGSDFGDLDSDPFDIAMPEPEPVPAVDVEAEKRQSYAEGYEAAESEARARYQNEIADLEAAHAQQLGELREQFEAQSTAAIAAGLQNMARELAGVVADQAALALAPLLSDLVAGKAVKDLAQLIEMAILSGDAGTIVVRGPLNLFEKLRDELPESADLLRHVEADDLDLSAEIGETLLVTRISAWTASLKKVLG